MRAPLQIRGERQWRSAVARAASVRSLEVHGPSTLSLEGLEEMVGLERVVFWSGGPTDQLHRLVGLERLERVEVHLWRGPHDAEALADCRIANLLLSAANARRALELAELEVRRVTGLETLFLNNHAQALIGWDCSWLPDVPTLRELDVSGFVPADDAAAAAIGEARQLRSIRWHDAAGVGSDTWAAGLRARLPGAEVAGWDYHGGFLEIEQAWRLERIPRGAALTLGPEQLARAQTVPTDAADLRRILTRWVPYIAERMTFADTPDGPRVETTHWTDLVFIQDLLVAGTPDAPEPGTSRTRLAIADPDLAAYVERFADEVRSGRYDDDAAAAAGAWHDGLAELEARGVDDHHETVVREQILDLLQEPLAAAGIDPEELLSFG